MTTISSLGVSPGVGSAALGTIDFVKACGPSDSPGVRDLMSAPATGGVAVATVAVRWWVVWSDCVVIGDLSFGLFFVWSDVWSPAGLTSPGSGRGSVGHRFGLVVVLSSIGGTGTSAPAVVTSVGTWVVWRSVRGCRLSVRLRSTRWL